MGAAAREATIARPTTGINCPHPSGKPFSRNIPNTRRITWLTTSIAAVEMVLPMAHTIGPCGRTRTRSRAPPTRSM